MGRLSRFLVAVALLAGVATAAPAEVAGFTRFGEMSADAEYGVSIGFRVELVGGTPERLELLLRLAGDEATFVAPVVPAGAAAEYVWDAADRHVTPNTRITYAWRATDGGQVTLSDEGELLYADDRFEWESARMGEATVHWYGGTAEIARRFGELTADGAAAAEELLGHEMGGAVDIFVYRNADDMFGALGPGSREWIGAATYPHLRTIFMQAAASNDYLERTIVHEVTHVVFNDATDNPYHEPTKWLNEGIATWAETGSAGEERSLVEFEASGGGLFAFEAISEQFPISGRGSSLAYAQGATMVDMIVAGHGREALAEIAAAYRDGASDAEALEAGTGESADELYETFYAEFDVEAPQPVEPAPIPPSDVRKPDGGPIDDGEEGGPLGSPTPGEPRGDGEQEGAPWLVVATVLAAAGLVLAGFVWGRRRVSREDAA